MEDQNVQAPAQKDNTSSDLSELLCLGSVIRCNIQTPYQNYRKSNTARQLWRSFVFICSKRLHRFLKLNQRSGKRWLKWGGTAEERGRKDRDSVCYLKLQIAMLWSKLHYLQLGYSPRG